MVCLLRLSKYLLARGKLEKRNSSSRRGGQSYILIYHVLKRESVTAWTLSIGNLNFCVHSAHHGSRENGGEKWERQVWRKREVGE